jgi:hypothetical protein
VRKPITSSRRLRVQAVDESIQRVERIGEGHKPCPSVEVGQPVRRGMA